MKPLFTCSAIALIAGMILAMGNAQDAAGLNATPVPTHAISSEKKDSGNLKTNSSEPENALKEISFKNDIAVPSTLYLMDDWQNDFFVRPIIKRWRPDNDFVVFNLDQGTFLRRFQTVMSIKKPVDNSVLSVKLINSDYFETVKEVSVSLKVASRTVDNGTIYASIIGDSYTDGGFYYSALIKNNLVPNLKLIGLRKAEEGYYDEGRAGWTLGSYFSVGKTPTSYHGFMHPEGNYRFWGSKEFWINAHLCAKNKQAENPKHRNACSRYDDYVKMFDEKTGYLISPSAGDIQFDNSINSFVLYDGKEWKETKQEFKWTFDYGKYLTMYHLHVPDIVFIELGLNDFRNNLTANYNLWKKRMDQMCHSILKANDKCKIAICIPCSTCGSIDNSSGAFTPMQDAAMWRFRSWLIETFDHKEKESIYLIDMGVCIDSVNGYDYSKNKEITHAFFDSSSAISDLKIQTDLPHPYHSYPQMGIPLAAFIQYYRQEIRSSPSKDGL